MLEENYINSNNAKNFLETAKSDDSVEFYLLSAYANDTIGNEIIAEEFYRLAGRKGIPDKHVIDWHRYFGSTLRWNSKFKESIFILKKGLEINPHDLVLKGFLSMSLFCNGDIGEEQVLNEIKATIPNMFEWAKIAIGI